MEIYFFGAFFFVKTFFFMDLENRFSFFNVLFSNKIFPETDVLTKVLETLEKWLHICNFWNMF